MGNEILKYLSKYIKLTEDQQKIIAESSIIRNYKKGFLLLREGEVCNEGYFVLKGCIRCYAILDGEEKTIDFYTEEQPVIPLAYGKNTPSEHFFECIEDTVALINTPGMETEIFKNHPEFESVCRIMTEVMMSRIQETLVSYKLTTPEERYLYLTENRPDILQRAPQYQIASYLGVKPESLSRIRKRLLKK